MSHRLDEIRRLEADTWSLAKAFASKYEQGKDRDIGEVYAGILDIYDSVLDIYGEILPRIAQLKAPSNDDLACELIDLELELKHVQDHARDAIRGIRHLSRALHDQSNVE